MDEAFWHERWESGRIGFHLDRVHPGLLKHWPQLEVASRAPVFVPLCGKSLDLAWLAGEGHPVTGIELSDIAIRDFFSESGHAPSVTTDPPFTIYSAAGISLLQGDFFALQRRQLPHVAAVYDRAALIALPPAMRGNYAQHLATLIAPGSVVLLITVEYDQREMAGPPFAVAPDEVKALLGAEFAVQQLELTPPLEVPPQFRQRGLTSLRERIYRLERR